MALGFWLAMLTGAATRYRAVPVADCNQAARNAVTYVAIDGNPFTPAVTHDGCWVFVTVTGQAPGTRVGVAVLRREGGKTSVVRTIPLEGSPTGAVLTHDELTLIVTTGSGVAFLDVARMESGDGRAVLGVLDTRKPIGTIFTNITRDDKYLLVSAERAASVLVIDMAKARRTQFDTSAIVGVVATGNAPIALTFSADERYVFTTAEAAPPALRWPVACRPEGQPTAAPNHPQGAVFVVDMARAVSDPAHAVVGIVAAGCNPVRLMTSPDGSTAYVTARGENNLLVFDTRKFLADSAPALIGRVAVGTAPVGLAVIDSGSKVVVTNSNRFAGRASAQQTLTVVNVARITLGAGAILGSIPAGLFPRELRVTSDGNTLLATNFNSHTLELVDLRRLPLEPVKR